MAARIRILHTADSHIGAQLPARPRNGGPRRGDDFVNGFERVLRLAHQRSCDLVIHAGDLFNSPDPSSRALAAGAESLLKLAAGGIPVVIVPGNHERSRIPATLLLAHRNIHILSHPQTIRFALNGMRVAVAGFPSLRNAADKRFADALAATEWPSAEADLRLLAVHETFESSVCGPAGYRFRSGDDVVERSAIPAEFDYVAAGHIHRQQTLSPATPDGPPIVYAGSPERISFAELSEPKGAVIIEAGRDGLAYEFVEHPVRPMSVWPIDVTGLSPGALVSRIDEIVTGLPDRAVAQIRLTGNTTRAVLRGLRLTARVRARRPDVLCTILTQAIEFVPRRVIRAPTDAISVFDVLQAPPKAPTRVTAEQLGALPDIRGVYALYDNGGRLLYVGQSGHVRTRVRAHVRGKSGANFFSGWGRDIGSIELRPADSALETLLIEAELIRVHRPPFNRQMRRWAGYCYLAENGKPHGQLDVCRVPSTHGSVFGPYRSRRLAADISEAAAACFGLAACPEESFTEHLPLLPSAGPGRTCRRYQEHVCPGPCAGRVGAAEYAARIDRRNSLLRGCDESAVTSLENQLASALEAAPNTRETRFLARQTRALRFAFDHAVVLADAARLRGGLLVMPGPGETRTVASLSDTGVRFERLVGTGSDASRVSRWHRLGCRVNPGLPLPVASLDCLCLAARQLQRDPGAYSLVPPTGPRRLGESGLPPLVVPGCGRSSEPDEPANYHCSPH